MSEKTKYMLAVGVWIGLGIGYAVGANADTVYLTEKPASPLKQSEAAKLTTPFFKCRQVILGKNLSPVVKPGTENSFHSSVGTGIENALDLLTDGKSKVFRCEEVEFNREKMKVARVK